MFRSIKMLSLVAGILIAAVAVAQTPAGAPAGSTGMCRDGSYWSGATKKGACHGHKGVQDWYGASSAGTSSSAKPAPAVPATPVAPSAAAAPATPAAKASGPSSVATTPAVAAGGGPGVVWVNTSTKVYHCQGDRWYGKTKHGEYMTEANAKAQNFRPDHGKACQ